MNKNQQIDAALNAHIKWFSHIKKILQSGQSSEFDLNVVRRDNACEFGKWLYGEFKKMEETKPIFEEIRDLHARFHESVAKIIELANAGNVDEVKSPPRHELVEGLASPLRFSFPCYRASKTSTSTDARQNHPPCGGGSHHLQTKEIQIR